MRRRSDRSLWKEATKSLILPVPCDGRAQRHLAPDAGYLAQEDEQPCYRPSKKRLAFGTDADFSAPCRSCPFVVGSACNDTPVNPLAEGGALFNGTARTTWLRQPCCP